MAQLAGKRVLVTQADDYMGPITLEVFAEQGAEVIADASDLTDPARAAALIDESDFFVGQAIPFSGGWAQ